MLLLSLVDATAQNTFTIRQMGGELQTFTFAEHPVINYEGNTMKLKTDKIEVEYPLASLDNVTFKYEPQNSEDGIEMLKVRTKLAKGDVMRVFDSKGSLIKTVKADGGEIQGVTLVVDDLPAGLYIVSQGNVSCKILKR